MARSDGIRQRMRLFVHLFILLPVLPQTAMAADPDPLYGRALEALGGAERLAAIQTLRLSEFAENFEPFEDKVSLGPPNHVSDTKTVIAWQPFAKSYRLDTRLETYYPFHGFWRNLQVFDGHAGARVGKDGFRPSPSNALAPARLGAELKNLWLTHPEVLMAHAEKVVRLDNRLVAGKKFPAFQFRSQGATWIVTLDPRSFLPRRIETIESDSVWEQVRNTYEFGDWRKVGGVKIPYRLAQYVFPDPLRSMARYDSNLIRLVLRSEVEINPLIENDAFRLADIPLKDVSDGSQRDWGWGMSHWFLRRAAMGGQADSDESRNFDLIKVGKGLYQVTGSSHHNLLIVGPKSLALVDAPLYPKRSANLLAFLRRRWPDKPVSHVILSHYHNDHMGGLRPYVEAGAQLIVPAADLTLYMDVVRRTTDRNPDFVSIWQQGIVPGFERRVEVYSVPNSHAEDMLMVLVPDQKLLFNTDLYSPGRTTQQPLWSKELYYAIRFYGLNVDHLVGGHGRGASPLSKLRQLVGVQTSGAKQGYR